MAGAQALDEEDSAEAAEENWLTMSIRIVDDNGETMGERLSIYPADASTPTLMLQCKPGGVAAFLSLEPVDFKSTILANNSYRVRSRTGELFVEDEVAYQGQWSYMPQIEVTVPRGKQPSIDVYNAVVRGDAISFKFRGEPKVEIQAPSVDEKFADFAERCAELRKSK